MKNGWVTKRLGEVCDFMAGYTPKPFELNSTGGYPYFKVSDMNRPGNELMMSHTELFVQNAKRIYPAKSIIFPKNGGAALTNKKRILAQESVVDLNTEVIVPLSVVLLQYLYLYFSFIDLSKFVKGAALPTIDLNSLKGTEIPVPPLAEQKRIVAKIDAAFEKIDKLKANAERNLANAKELFQSALNEAMRPKPGWVEKRLGEVCGITSALVDPTEKNYSKLLHVGGANIISNTGELVELKSAKEEKLRSGKFCFDATMVLYNKIRPYLKKVARPDFAGLCSADMYPLAPAEGIDRDYLYYVLLSDEFTSYAMANSERAGMPKLNRAALFGYSVCWPKSKAEQAQVAKTLDALACSCSRLQSNYTRLIADCAEMRQAVLKEAFEGRL